MNAIGESPTLSREMASSESSIAVEFDHEPISPFPAEPIKVTEFPSIPSDLTPGQRAQVCEILDYLHSRIYKMIESVQVNEATLEATMKLPAFQRLARHASEARQNEPERR